MDLENSAYNMYYLLGELIKTIGFVSAIIILVTIAYKVIKDIDK
jgi:hypothetical protein